MQTGFSRYSAWPFFILVALQIAAIPMIVPEPEISHHAPFSIVTQVCAFLIWILLIEAWYRLAGLEDCGAMIAVSGGCILLILLVFGPSMPQVWMARFVPLVPYPLRAAAVAIHPVFLHPVVVDRIHEWRMKLTGKGWLLVALVALPVAGWFLRSVQISRDGYECVEFVSQDVWQGELREPLTILLHKVWATWVMWAFPVNAEQALALLSCALGVPVVYLLVRTVRIWAAESGRDAWIPVGMALASGGFLLMWFGHIEVYPVLVAGMIAVCFLAARCLVERKSLIWLMLAYGLLLPFHLSAVWMLPAVIYVAVVAWRRDGVRPVVLAVLALVLVEMLVWGGICVGYYGGSVGAMVRQFWGEMNVGSDKAMFYGMGEMVSFSHLADFVQETLYLSCPAVLGFSSIWVAGRVSAGRPWRFFSVWGRWGMRCMYLCGGRIAGSRRITTCLRRLPCWRLSSWG